MSIPFQTAKKQFQQEGVVDFLKNIPRRTRKLLKYQRGTYSLSLQGNTVSFSSPTVSVAERNHRRFTSEKEELTDILSELQPTDVVYDIGANTGLYSLFAAKEVENGQVIAFEPYPPNVQLLEQDISRNELFNVDVRKIVLSDSEGTVSFDQPTTDDIGFGSAAIEATESESTIEKPTTTGDSLIENGEISEPNVVKIDVEGAEALVVDGLQTALAQPSCRIVYCEVHLPENEKRPSIEDFGSTAEELRERFEELGFSVETIETERSEELFFKARK